MIEELTVYILSKDAIEVDEGGKILAGINEEQKKAIEKTEGPLMIIAGPGTGKTRTLIERTRYILNQGLARPEEITLTTFTKKAAEELISRLSEEGEKWNGAQVHVFNFHQMAGKLLQAAPSQIPYQPFYRIVSPEEIRRLVFQHWPILTGRGKFSPEFLNTEEGRAFLDLRDAFLCLFPRANAPNAGQEKRNQRAYLHLMERIREGFVGWDEGKESQSAKKLLSRFQKMLVYYNILDYSEILYQAARVLEDEKTLRTAQKSCRYLMVDEYQDTNPIQEKILSRLAQGTGNLCIVGDDDQSLYRFRGATVENLFTFTDRYPGAQVIRLNKNYRSAPKILALAQNFIERPYGNEKDQVVSGLRYQKDLFAQRKEAKGQAFLYEEKDPKTWAEGICDLIEDLHRQGQPYSQMAILSHSVRDYNENMTLLRKALKNRTIPLQETGSGRLTSQEEVKGILAALLLTLLGERKKDEGEDFGLPALFSALPRKGEEERKALQKEWEDFFNEGKWTDLTSFALSFLKGFPFKELAEEALQGNRRGKEKIKALAAYLKAEEEIAISDQREKIGKENRIQWARWLWEDWKTLKERNIEAGSLEETDEDGVRIMTIHQSKGLEFSTVILEEDSLKKTYYPPKEGTDLLPPSPLLAHPPQKKWAERMDRLRETYTAMTRARDLLILTRTEVKTPWGGVRPLAPYLERINRELPPLNRKEALDIFPAFSPEKGKTKKIYAYTTDLALYETCPRRYFFHRVLEIPSPKTDQAAFGSLVHWGLKNLHEKRKAQENFSAEEKDLEKEFERTLFLAGEGLKKGGQRLSPKSLDQAKKILLRYPIREKDRILKGDLLAEQNFRLSMENYLLQGNLDLLMDGGRGILDFKSSVPKEGPLLDRYLGQLKVYRILVEGREEEQKKGREKQEKEKREEGLYDLSALLEEGLDPLFLWRFSEKDLQREKESVDHIVQQIEKGAFQQKSARKKDCLDCPFRFFCGREKA